MADALTWALDQLEVKVSAFWAWVIIIVALVFIIGGSVASIMTIMGAMRRRGKRMPEKPRQSQVAESGGVNVGGDVGGSIIMATSETVQGNA
jgi:hypothetical protein